jgi:hypothetical protein
MHATNNWFDVLDVSRRALSNAGIPRTIGALLTELLAPERPPWLPLVGLSATPGHNSARVWHSDARLLTKSNYKL